ncbi:hypothetical protein PPTG_19899 [Phytophthora nicotianae INRA-310]|uniref:Uncharacterized protein n=1 Tax=Phytophthora nicotianae (strain INRA-310) TaxID=761204 RepID=W2PAQ3_PHYN3|nr:hypothetical protein PPTG_19899 [Phytophthora nicotianae INRA-310]ETM97901.1 hypothetical protein PPTG_19899 [Phytophthora nicotianae INRA-310]
MVHLALHWKLRCIQDSSASEDENTPPKMLRENTTQDKITSKKSCGDKSSDDSSSTGTATPPWMSPGFTKFGYLKAVSNQPPASQSSTETEDSPLRRSRLVASHTASSSAQSAVEYVVKPPFHTHGPVLSAVQIVGRLPTLVVSFFLEMRRPVDQGCARLVPTTPLCWHAGSTKSRISGNNSTR